MKFVVDWYKTYRRHGQDIIEADSAEDAKEVAYNKLGDFEGSKQYYPDESEITLIKPKN